MIKLEGCPKSEHQSPGVLCTQGNTGQFKTVEKEVNSSSSD